MTGKENFFGKAKADGEVFVRTVNLVTKLSKVKLTIRAKKKEREKLLKSVGVNLYEIFFQTRKLDSEAITRAAMPDLQGIEQLAGEISQLEQEAEQLKADFRAANEKGKPPHELDQR